MSATESLTALVRAGTNEGLLAVADGLDSGRITLESSPVGIGALKGVSDDLASEAFRAFQLLDVEMDSRCVSTVIRTAVGIRTEERLDWPAVEVCWTGPQAEGPLVTPNAAAVERLLKECRDTGEILLVGYSLTVSKGAFMEDVIALLADASRRRAKIQVVLHQDEESHNRRELMKAWDVFARKPEVYTWDPPADHPYTKLHAKCLVVDRLQMLVTSANFTFHGLESNIELGLLVRNQPLASAVHERFDHLIRSKVLRKWEDVA
ncbi:MAG: phospholipase D-like domain-containing protein [Thermoleophilia bacterium]